jgi:hypothetical protein
MSFAAIVVLQDAPLVAQAYHVARSEALAGDEEGRAKSPIRDDHRPALLGQELSQFSWELDLPVPRADL